MVELVQYHERVFQNVTVQHVYGLIPRSVAAIDASVGSWQTDLNPWHGDLEFFRKQLQSLLDLRIQNQMDNESFEPRL
jgi:hypothetical protein